MSTAALLDDAAFDRSLARQYANMRRLSDLPDVRERAVEVRAALSDGTL